jgi:hypothetical protein
MNHVLRFFSFLILGLLCSNFPWVYVGMYMGFPAVVLNSLILTIYFRKTSF